ncbi:hypothetical protein IGL98_000656 [Enterococcus sp. DIV0840]
MVTTANMAMDPVRAYLILGKHHLFDHFKSNLDN